MFNSQDSLPQWNTVSIDRRLAKEEGGFPQVSMGHYLILLVHEYVPGSTFLPKKEPKLLAFDLRDNSIQEANLDASLFPDNIGNFTFTKYQDNQIIKFGGCKKNLRVGEEPIYGPMVRITVESFKPFSVKYEEINVNGEQLKVERHTAQIYNDCLYVYGGDVYKHPYDKEKALWSFNLNTLAWKMCQSSGEIPDFKHRRSSFILQDHLYIYAGEEFYRETAYTKAKDIFMLNLNSMIWKKLEQTETYLLNRVDSLFDNKEFDGVLYQDHLLILGGSTRYEMSETEPLCCWNPNNNSWKTFDIETNKFPYRTRKLTVSNNLLVSSGFSEHYQVFGISILNLDHVGLQIPELPQRSLFMNEEESDVKLKIQDQIIPARKQILIEKSKYFANLFNSGMSESKQEIIEIADCDHLLFQEFLRFLYYGELKKDEDLAMKLFVFADKYVQNDLREKCMNFLKYNINPVNVYKILDFARQEDVPYLRSWCVNFLKDKITPHNISGLVKYLNHQNNPEFAQENLELRDKAISVLTNNYTEITKDQNSSIYEEFLIRNLSFETVLVLVNFISGYNHKNTASKGLFGGGRMAVEGEEMTEERKEKIKPQTVNLRAALYSFVQRNLDTLTENKTIKEIPHAFLVDLIRNITEIQDKNRRNLHEEEQQTSQ